MDTTSDIFHAIADANRRRLLDILADGEERPVQELVTHFTISFQAVSQHLHILADAGLVTRRKAGRYRYYRARPEGLRAVHEWTARYKPAWDRPFDTMRDRV